MRTRHFFGYGSLVNRATHDYAGAFDARLKGWQRAWRRSPTRALCYLTAIAAPGGEILGVVSPVPVQSQEVLDRREHAYARLDVTSDTRHEGHAAAVELHVIPEGAHFAPGPENAILLSYLDVVVQGYLQEFGAEGVAHFFATTEGWQAPVLDDRAAPVYPRAQELSAAQVRLVDRALEQVGAPVLRLAQSQWGKYLQGVRRA